MRLLFVACLFGGLYVPAAQAQDGEEPFGDLLNDDEDDFGKDFTKPEEKPQPKNPDQPVEAKPTPDPEPELDFEENPDATGPDLLQEDPEANQTLGGDSDQIYRKELERVEKMDVDDEMQIWEAYLTRYPNTAFRNQIEARVKELEDKLYDAARPDNGEGDGPVDNKDKQLSFSQALLLESINPRRRVFVLLEWGLPDWASLALGYEHAFGKKFSVQGQFRRRFSGPSIEAGVRWSLVKSQRNRMLVTVLADVHVNAAPAFFGFRPQLAIGKSFGNLDIQAQGGVDLTPRRKFDVYGIGGLHLTYRIAKPIAVFAESSLLIKNQSGAAGPFRFNQIAFGMRFFPLRKAKKPDNVEVNLGASIPYTSAYWQYHYGAVVGQTNIYLD